MFKTEPVTLLPPLALALPQTALAPIVSTPYETWPYDHTIVWKFSRSLAASSALHISFCLPSNSTVTKASSFYLINASWICSPSPAPSPP